MSGSVSAVKAVPGRGLFARLRGNRDGFTAVEFALVAAPFLAFVFAILEVALVYFGTFTLENAVDQAARQIRTGQASAAGWSADDFKSEICSKVATFSDCNAGLKVDVRSFGSFSSMTPPDSFDGNGDLDDTKVGGFSIGGGGDVVLVTVYYKWSLIGDIPGIGLTNQSDGTRLIVAMAAFRNEPFEGS
ncbi:MAG: pilus assembly protein [Rhizobiales bacterium]|nr:pilus assembly protein [Hyphomicrobiales bacterium]